MNVSGLKRKAGILRVFERHSSICEMRNLGTDELHPLPESWVETPPEEEMLQGW